MTWILGILVVYLIIKKIKLKYSTLYLAYMIAKYDIKVTEEDARDFANSMIKEHRWIQIFF